MAGKDFASAKTAWASHVKSILFIQHRINGTDIDTDTTSSITTYLIENRGTIHKPSEIVVT